MKFWKSLYISDRLFIILILVTVLYIVGQYIDIARLVATIVLIGCGVVTVLDLFSLYSRSMDITLTRELPERLSVGDHNQVLIKIKNSSNITVDIDIIDELPSQFQIRDFKINDTLKSGENKRFEYHIRPTTRGEFFFGCVNLFVNSKLNIVRRRICFEGSKMVPVFPSFIQMKKYELLAINNTLTNQGIKKIRKVGLHSEFEKIRDYVSGDDFRTINWKATARKAELMVNQYQDEKSQSVYSVINMGRIMKMPFNGMTLLDYAINASLVISNIAQKKYDRPGLLTYSNRIGSFVKSSNQNSSVSKIMEVLYNQETNFSESDNELLATFIKRNIRQRSLIVLYTNFESLTSLEMQAEYFRQISKNHLLLVVFFENTEITNTIKGVPKRVEGIYLKTLSEKYLYDKKTIVRILNKHGIHALYTKPENLNIGLINKYLEFKAKELI